MNIVILYGQPVENAGKDEQDTLIQVEVISQVLSRLGMQSIAVPLSLDLQEAIQTLRWIRPDIVFNLVESVAGQGRLIHLAPALLDTLKIPYTGAKTETMFLTSNKLLAKKFLQHSELPTPEWFSSDDLKGSISLTPGMYILKSVWEHASIGISEGSVIQAETISDLDQALTHYLDRLGGEGFIESYIDGREFNLSLLSGDGGPEVLPPAEICFNAYPEGKLKIVDYHAKWVEDSFEYHNTPRRFDFSKKDEPLLNHLKALAKACWRLFGLRGYARVDFRVDQRGEPWILEINTNPCLSPDAGFMAAANTAGLRFEQVVERIIRCS
jgi:D-alanine-D-alanine ligase